MAANKRQLRQRVLARRDGLSPKERQEKSHQVVTRLLAMPEVQGAKVLMVYASMGSEVDTTELVNWAWRQGKRVAFPLTVPRTKELLAVPVVGWEQLSPGTFGVREPDPREGQIPGQEIDAVIVPALAFDPRGYRIGYGAGYYDRFLPKVTGSKIGIAFKEQLLPMVPAEVHDVPVDWVVTDQETILCRRGSDIG